MINNLSASQLNCDRPRWQRRQVNLIAVVSAAINAVSLTSQAKKIQIKSLLDSAAALVLGDAERLQQVCWHLLSQAIESAPVGGRVEVRLVLEHSASEPQIPLACIEVRHHNQSISAKSLPRVIVGLSSTEPPLVQSSQNQSVDLAIARHLVERHGGTIDVASAISAPGSNFTVKLPLLESNGEAKELVNQTDRHFAVLTPNFSLSDLRILVVDREADSRNQIVTVLEQAGAEVKAIASAMVALKVLSQWKPHLLINHVAMPEQEGYALIHQVRQLTPDRGGKVPAVAITARASEAESIRVLNAGFQLHVPQPVLLSQLTVVVAALTGRNTQI